jgi:hypothetical protein
MILSGMLHDHRTNFTLSYEASATAIGGGLTRIDGRCGYTNTADMAEFSFVYVPEFHDAIVYSTYKLEYVENRKDRPRCCAQVTLSNPHYFEDIAEMSTMAPCVKTATSRTIVYLRPLVGAVLGANPLNQLILPIERFAYYRRG